MTGSEVGLSTPSGLQPGQVFRVAALFVPAAALGTVGHELGHWVAAWGFGCDPVLHFAFVSPHCSPALAPPLELAGVAAGPLSSMATGLLGMAGLWRWSRTHSRLDLAGTFWSMLAMFWSRPLCNLVVQLGAFGLGRAPWEVVARSDEARLSRMLSLPELSLGLGMALLSLLACGWTLRCIPPADRLSWFLGALVGALLGFALWMRPIGPMLLP